LLLPTKGVTYDTMKKMTEDNVKGAFARESQARVKYAASCLNLCKAEQYAYSSSVPAHGRGGHSPPKRRAKPSIQMSVAMYISQRNPAKKTI